MSDVYDKLVFRQRNRNRLYDIVVRAMEESGLRRKEIADRLGVNPSQVTRWISGPGNWELDTVSDLLWVASGELDYKFTKFSDRKPANHFHPAGEPREQNTIISTTETRGPRLSNLEVTGQIAATRPAVSASSVAASVRFHGE